MAERHPETLSDLRPEIPAGPGGRRGLRLPDRGKAARRNNVAQRIGRKGERGADQRHQRAGQPRTGNLGGRGAREQPGVRGREPVPAHQRWDVGEKGHLEEHGRAADGKGHDRQEGE